MTQIKEIQKLKRYVYVVCYDTAGQEDTEVFLGFHHWFIEARDEDHAYEVGLFKHAPQRFLNDYVIEIPESQS